MNLLSPYCYWDCPSLVPSGRYVYRKRTASNSLVPTNALGAFVETEERTAKVRVE